VICINGEGGRKNRFLLLEGGHGGYPNGRGNWGNSAICVRDNTKRGDVDGFSQEREGRQRAPDFPWTKVGRSV